MEIIGLFSIPILETTLDNIDPSVLEYIKSLPFQPTNNCGSEYTCSKKLQNDPFFYDLFSIVKEIADIYSEEVLGYDLDNKDYSIDIKTSWSIKMPPGAQAGEHHHDQSLFTAVLYLKVDNNGSNKLHIKRPVQYNPTIDIDKKNWNLHNCKDFFIVPKPNKLIFLPSYLDHHVDKNESDETLYCLVFDFFPRGVLQKNTTSELILNW